MKKRILTLLLASALVLSSCGNPSQSSQANNPSGKESNDIQTEEPNSGDEYTESDIPSETAGEEVPSFEEITVADNEECSIKITGIDPQNAFGYSLKLTLENKSADKTYMFSVSGASINGVETDPLFAQDVAAGKKANSDINFLDSALSDNGITDFTDIELSFRVYDNDDWMADAVAEETVHIYPYGEDKATVFKRQPQSTDNIIIDNEYVTVTVIGYENDSIWGYTLKLFLENKSDKNIMFSVDEASINGYMMDPFYAKSVAAGKCAFSSMSWANTTLEENGITEVNNIEFTLRAYDNDDFTANDLANEVITLTP